VRDPEQPRAHRRARHPAAEGRERARHRRLQDVPGVLVVAHDRPAVPVQGLVMALEQDRERPVAPRRRQSRKTVVGQQPERKPARRPSRRGGGEIAHSPRIGNARRVQKSECIAAGPKYPDASKP
jgi:hypothetical protein